MSSIELDTRSVALALGVSVRQLGHWDDLGIVSPSARPAIGSGSRRRYAHEDLLLLLVTRELRRCHLPLDEVREAVAHLRAVLQTRPATDDLVVWANQALAYAGPSDAEAIAACRNAASAVVLNLGKLRAELDRLAPTAAQPVTRLIHVGQRSLQVLLVPEAEGFLARCNAHPTCIGRGQHADDAVAALQREIAERTPLERSADKPRRTRRSQPDAAEQRGSGGAATWGGDW